MNAAAALPPPLLYGFEPDAERVRTLDRRLRAQLGETVAYLVEQLEAHTPIPREQISRFLRRLPSGPLPPLAYAIYSDLVLAIDRDDLNESGRLLDRLLGQQRLAEDLQIIDLAPGDEDSDRYLRYAEHGSGLRLDLRSPTPEMARANRDSIGEALALVQGEDPLMAAELCALLREIVLCRSGASSSSVQFDGASNFMLWGAVLLNADRPRDRLAMLQMLAHESAHNLLFGLCPDEPLVTNDPNGRYASPLRDDLRPMEGIYHATFVCARMHRALSRLVQGDSLSQTERGDAGWAMDRNDRAFRRGLQTLDAHADFTDVGRAILEGARGYMNRH